MPESTPGWADDPWVPEKKHLFLLTVKPVNSPAAQCVVSVPSEAYDAWLQDEMTEEDTFVTHEVG